ncbi:MAG: beta-phosphoglucomutase [Chloroflexi bacterium]|nr:beta-phosphoglucomutase [Chloroflexota bacterium]
MDNWHIEESGFVPDGLHHKEAIFSIGNGYLGTRGTFEEGYPEETAATLIAGLYDDRPIVFTELANAPNWLNLNISINGQRFRMDQGKLLDYHRLLDLRDGTLTRTLRWQSPGGEQLDLEFERFASLADEHVMGVRCRVRAINFEGQLEVRAGLSGYPESEGWEHWNLVDQGKTPHRGAFLQLQTRHTHIDLCGAFHLRLFGGAKTRYGYWDAQGFPTIAAQTRIKPGMQVIAEKIVAIYTGRDVPDPRAAAEQKLAAAAQQGYQALHAASEAAWKEEWRRCNVTIEGDDEADRDLRFNLFQLLAAAPRHDERVSIPARTLSGFGYKGHIFWDTDLFILPFFTFTRPEIARNLLMYRYHTLENARQKARQNGFEGAQYPWESASTGEEVTPRFVPGPDGENLVRIWTGDIELHITADVAYAVMLYWRVAGDDPFMRDYGAEIVLEAARFWGSRAAWNATRKKFEIQDVIGPDENHEHVNDNAFTNHLARWNLKSALEVMEWLRLTDPQRFADLEKRLELSKERVERWKDVIERIEAGFDPQTGLYEQFAGYFRLEPVDLQSYEPRSRSMQAILGIEGIQKTQVIKQPDVLMLLYLLGQEGEMGVLETNWKYYTPLTDLAYGSSLGPAVQAALAARLGHTEDAYRHFLEAARTDPENTRGNTPDGIHAATAGGLWQAAIFGLAGLQVGEKGLKVSPRLPSHWKRMEFSLQFHGRRYEFDLPAGTIEETAATSPADRLPRLPIRGAIFDLDGVLTDTSELHYRAWKRLADEEGLPFSRADNEGLRGIPRRESLIRLLKGKTLPEARLQVLMERKNRYYLEIVNDLTPEDLLPGAKELLQEIRRAGVKIAIGSASKNARLVIERLGIAALVDAVSDGYSVSRQKPAPDLFLHAADQLGIDPSHSVVFEDAGAGVAAALAGGMWAVGLGPGERVGKAHIIIPNLEGVRWTYLVAQFKLWMERNIQEFPFTTP